MVLRIAHRGASGYEPENTPPSFQRAIELGAKIIETDIRLCGSGEPVAIHDNRVDRTTDGTGLVAAKTLNELKVLDAGKGQKIPTLVEVLEFVDEKVMINLHLKERGLVSLVNNVIEEYVKERHRDYDHFLVSLFYPEELLKLRNLNPYINLGILFKWNPLALKFANKLQPYSIHPYYRVTNQIMVNYAHQKGIKVFPWTVNNQKGIEGMKSLGVDGIITDYPDRI